MKMADICTVDFFNELGIQIKSDSTFGETEWIDKCGQFIQDFKLQLFNNMLVNYNMDAIEIEGYTPNEYALKFFYPLYGREIVKIYQSLFMQYNINKYLDIETTEDYSGATENVREYNSSKDKTGTDTETQSGSDVFNFETTNNNIQTGLTTYDDTSEYNPTEQMNQTDNGEDTTTYGKVTTLGYNSSEGHSGSDTDTGSKTYDRSVHKIGNIGMITNQQLIQQEVNLRLRNSFVSYLTRMLVSCFSTGLWSD